MRSHAFRTVLMILLAASTSLAAARAEAIEVKVETTGHRLFADAGDSGSGFATAALITVLVTAAGRPVADLGASIPPSPTQITLPPGWQLRTVLGPPGPVGTGCTMSPISFTNAGAGVYTIRVVPFLSAPECHWGLGDYHYTVGLSNAKVQGVGLGVLTIPDSPSVP